MRNMECRRKVARRFSFRIGHGIRGRGSCGTCPRPPAHVVYNDGVDDEQIVEHFPKERREALRAILRSKRTAGEAEALAVSDPSRALGVARSIEDPWFRCQSLAGVAARIGDPGARLLALVASL